MLPSGETAESRRAFVNPAALTMVQAVELVANDEGGETAITTDIGEVPLGTKEIYVQHRMCGDFYCFIHGSHQVAATGNTREEAFRNAVKLAA